MTVYTAEKPPTPSREELRQRVRGWGVDLDPADRPSVPRERYAPEATGAHWDFPECQKETSARERSIEHRQMTPVFGTSCPLHGLSGGVRSFAYRRYSEGRLAHWLLLMLGDRIDAAEAHVRSMASLRPDNPITETGVLSEFRVGGWSDRVGTKRADGVVQAIDPLLVGGPWIASLGAAYVVARRVIRLVRR